MDRQGYKRKNDCWHNKHEHERATYTCPDCGNIERSLRKHKQHTCDQTDDDPDGEKNQGPSANNDVSQFFSGASA
jgi:predicted RNA-binding Zn-ribbon protein involved in translation (DUF1610 family)